MNAALLLKELATAGIDLEKAGEKLKFTAPDGVVTPAILASLRLFKDDLLALLKDDSGRSVTDSATGCYSGRYGDQAQEAAAAAPLGLERDLPAFLRRWPDVPALHLLRTGRLRNLADDDHDALRAWVASGSAAAGPPLLVLRDAYNSGERELAVRLGLELQRLLDPALATGKAGAEVAP